MTEASVQSGAAPGSTADNPWLRQVSAGEPYDLDALMELSGLDGATLLPRLLTLELQGRVSRAGGGRFVRSGGRW